MEAPMRILVVAGFCFAALIAASPPSAARDRGLDVRSHMPSDFSAAKKKKRPQVIVRRAPPATVRLCGASVDGSFLRSGWAALSQSVSAECMLRRSRLRPVRKLRLPQLI